MNIFALSVMICFFFLLLVLEMIRRRKISERYSILWLILGLLMLIFSIFPVFLNFISKILGIVYGTSLLFFIGFLFSIIFILHITTVITKQDRKMTLLIQEVALLKSSQEKNNRKDLFQ